jgi:hypothetical protein
MTTQSAPKQLAIFPDWLRSGRFVDDKGNLTPQAQLFFELLTNALQTNYKPEGIVVPPQTASNIAMLTAEQSLTNIIYDSTNNLFNGNLQSPSGQVWLPFAMITSYAGNPNGHVAGQLLWFCWDSSGQNLYICTTAGTTGSAVWTGVATGAIASIDALLLL